MLLADSFSASSSMRAWQPMHANVILFEFECC